MNTKPNELKNVRAKTYHNLSYLKKNFKTTV